MREALPQDCHRPSQARTASLAVRRFAVVVFQTNYYSPVPALKAPAAGAAFAAVTPWVKATRIPEEPALVMRGADWLHSHTR